MKRKTLGYLVVLILSVASCGSDSPQEQQSNKDAAIDRKDAPAVVSDVLAKADGHDAPAPNADLPVPADTKDAPAVTNDTNPPPDLADAPGFADGRDARADAPTALDAGAETKGVDLGGSFDGLFDSLGERPSLDLGAPEVAMDASAPVSFACRNDSDCCIAMDSCKTVAYLYSNGPGAGGPPSIPPTTGMCTPCIPPAIQVRCATGQCVGQKVSGYPASLIVAHCGYVSLGDGGVTSQHKIDAGAVSTQTSWGCGS